MKRRRATAKTQNDDEDDDDENDRPSVDGKIKAIFDRPQNKCHVIC